ncbi:MAG: hypothetical protein OER86_07350 [Phycisphaerae bacterium]|nr:hypothetical protein [Phycisphaerae bacterium]
MTCHHHQPSRRRPLALLLLGLLTATAAGGCEMAGVLAHAAVGDKKPILDVEAEYRGLDNQTIAVLVNASDSVLLQQPRAPLEAGTVVSEALAGNIPGARVISAREIAAFQNRNLYWDTEPFSRLAERLKVSRLVLIELGAYRLHEPGNINIWQGVMRARVVVAEADGPRPNDAAYSTDIHVRYPPDGPVGLVRADDATMRFATLDLFAKKVAGKFYDHIEDPNQP